jgi:hypothetical protein
LLSDVQRGKGRHPARTFTISVAACSARSGTYGRSRSVAKRCPTGVGYLPSKPFVTLGMNSTREWVVERWRGGVPALHHRPVPVDGQRRLSILEFDEPALVLGSRGPDPQMSEITTRRQSGGGIVWLDPRESTWIDVTLPRNDPLWSDDLSRSFHWVGETIASAFVDLGLNAGTYKANLVGTGSWCFDGIGPGEVILSDRKLVGIAQRRTRRSARFQCVWYRRFQRPQGLIQMNSKGIGWADAGLNCSMAEVRNLVVSKLLAA